MVSFFCCKVKTEVAIVFDSLESLVMIVLGND